MIDNEHIDSPEEELKRADHLVYVSLKYTRTCDVMRNAIQRLINAFEMGFAEYLEYMRKRKKIAEVPASGKEKYDLAKKHLGVKAKKYLALYNTLKKIEKADHCDVDEFRKNVTLKTKGSNSVEVKTDTLGNYLDMTKEFVLFIRQQMK
jgi:hypothetical protein